MLDTTEEQYEKVLAINLKSAFFGTQLAAQQMIKQGGGGRIINITSVHEDWPMPGNTAYCLSKGGMRMLTRTAGVELAPHNILVVGVGPGAVATPINLSTMNDPALMKKLDTAIPLGRMAQAGRDRQRGRLPGRRRRELHDGDDHLRRRRHHAQQPRAVVFPNKGIENFCLSASRGDSGRRVRWHRHARRDCNANHRCRNPARAKAAST